MSILHTVTLENRRIKVNPKRFVQGGINSDEIVVSADAEWHECDHILVSFQHDSIQDPMTLIYPGIGVPLKVPRKMMDPIGYFRLSFTGYVNGKVRLTTEIQSDSQACNVVEAGYIAGDYIDEEQEGIGDLIAQTLDAAEEAKEAAKLAEEAAKRATRISTGDGPPTLGGIEGDLYIDAQTGALYEFSNQEG